MASILYKVSLFALVLVCACADDDAPSRDERLDGSMDGAADESVLDASHDAMIASDAMLADGAIEPDSSIIPDANEAGVCERIAEPLLPTFEDPLNATRVPLASLCSGPCVQLAGWASALVCTELADDAMVADFDFGDAGADYLGWFVRREGCGNVQFESYGSWPRIVNFDSANGEVIGVARQDDTESTVRGCVDWAFVGGMLKHHCAEDVVSVCFRD
jgi:hypothetical protein